MSATVHIKQSTVEFTILKKNTRKKETNKVGNR